MSLRGLREPRKNECEQGIICRMIKSLIKITSQDQMASRGSGEYLCILIGHPQLGKDLWPGCCFLLPGCSVQAGLAWKEVPRGSDLWTQGCRGFLQKASATCGRVGRLLRFALEGLFPQEQALRHGFNSK